MCTHLYICHLGHVFLVADTGHKSNCTSMYQAPLLTSCLLTPIGWSKSRGLEMGKTVRSAHLGPRPGPTRHRGGKNLDRKLDLQRIKALCKLWSSVCTSYYHLYLSKRPGATDDPQEGLSLDKKPKVRLGTWKSKPQRRDGKGQSWSKHHTLLPEPLWGAPDSYAAG